jgi:hypothetical protein
MSLNPTRDDLLFWIPNRVFSVRPLHIKERDWEVFLAYVCRGETGREIASRHSISSQRVFQIAKLTGRKVVGLRATTHNNWGWPQRFGHYC